MNNVMVSVVMPAYNCEKYIDQAIESVLQQTVLLELIVVEDSSSDSTGQHVEKYLSDPRVVYVKNQVNLGVSESRNVAIRQARGKYIAFLDSDDFWTADKLEKQIEIMEEKKAVLSSTARELMDENGRSIGKVIPVPEVIQYRDLLKSNTINTSGAMVRTDVANEFLMREDNLHEDYIMWLQILKKYGKAYGLNEPLLKYRVLKNSKSGNKMKSARMTWGVYKYMELNFLQRFYYFLNYAVNGVLKYR